MDADRLFTESLGELEARATSDASEYSLLRASSILRLLLLDGTPLVAEVNRTRDITVSYRVRRSPKPKPEDLVLWLGGLDPDDGTEVSGSIEDLRRDDFLAVPVLYLGPEVITIHDMISLAANIWGGVHHGQPRKDNWKQQLVEKLNQRMKLELGDTPVQLLSMIAVSRVVLRGLQPLREAVLADLPPAYLPEPGGGRQFRVTMVASKEEAEGSSVQVRFTVPPQEPE
jgi:hypothetical protein